LCLPPFLLVYFTFALTFAFACLCLPLLVFGCFFVGFSYVWYMLGFFNCLCHFYNCFLMRIFTNQPTKNNEYISYNSGFLLLKVNTYVVVERNASNCN